jgi:hypothetical protein
MKRIIFVIDGTAVFLNLPLIIEGATEKLSIIINNTEVELQKKKYFNDHKCIFEHCRKFKTQSVQLNHFFLKKISPVCLFSKYFYAILTIASRTRALLSGAPVCLSYSGRLKIPD